MLLFWFSFLKITLAYEAIWRKAVVEKDRILKDSNGDAVNEIIELLGHDRNQASIIKSVVTGFLHRLEKTFLFNLFIS